MYPLCKVCMRWLQFFLLIVCFIANRCIGLQEGESCRHQGAEGVCTPYSQCTRGARVTVCSYSAQEAIVCCPQSLLVRPNYGGQTESSNRATGVRKSVQKCNEYKKLTTESVSIGVLTLNPTLVKIDVPKCETVVKLIVGGNVTKPGEFPHMAAIGWPLRTGGYSFDCGGSLISDNYVLTAAHCYWETDDGILPAIVRLGDQSLFRDNDGAEPKDYDILRFILHPEYRLSRGKYNDLALIQLRDTVQFTNFIRPACLYDSDILDVETAIATGFGLLESYGVKSDELRKVSLHIYENGLCGKQYLENRFVKQGILSTQLCAGDLAGGKDTCQGDSGGPLQITREENQCIFYIIGVTSFGKVCGSSTPAIYTKVAPYLNWIESVVWP